MSDSDMLEDMEASDDLIRLNEEEVYVNNTSPHRRAKSLLVEGKDCCIFDHDIVIDIEEIT